MISTSIVIPLYGGLELTKACHEALVRTLAHRDDVEVVYVDNASPDDTRAWLATVEGERTVVVAFDENRNFSGGCNAGVSASRGRVVVLLNNDTEPQAGWLEPLERALADETIGMVGCLLTYPDGAVQHCGVTFPPNDMPEHVHVGAKPDDPRVTRARDVQAVTAACCAVRRATWEALGGLDEGYANGGEDMDLCLRVRAAGLRIAYEPAALVVHHESKSDGRFLKAGDNIRRFLAQHAAELVPDQHVFDVLAGVPELAPISADELPGTDNTALRGWREQRALVERIGGMDLSLPERARVADWLDRVRLCGGVVVSGGPVDAWSCRGREAELAGGDATAERTLVRRWGRCDPAARIPVQLLPLGDVPSVEDADVQIDVRARALLVSVADSAAFAQVATDVFAAFGGSDDVSVVLRVPPGDDASYDALERAADAVGDRLPDVVVVEAGPEAELALARACSDVVVGGDEEARLQQRCLARIAGARPLDVGSLSGLPS